MRGHYVEPISEDLKERFLDLVASGHTRQEAAKALDASARRFRALCSTDSTSYDEEFARRYAKLTEKGGEHETALVERLQSAAVERSIRSSDRLLEKLLTIHDPAWAIHRPQALQITNVNVEELRMLVPNMPDEALHEIVASYERQKQLESGDIIDQP